MTADVLEQVTLSVLFSDVISLSFYGRWRTKTATSWSDKPSFMVYKMQLLC